MPSSDLREIRQHFSGAVILLDVRQASRSSCMSTRRITDSRLRGPLALAVSQTQEKTLSEANIGGTNTKLYSLVGKHPFRHVDTRKLDILGRGETGERRDISLIISLLLYLSYYYVFLSVNLVSVLSLLKSHQKKFYPHLFYPLRLLPAKTSIRQAVADIGSRPSREDGIVSKQWEAKAQKVLISTTKLGKVEVIYSLLPFEDKKTAIRLLKARADLDTLFALHCKYQVLSIEQRVDPSSLKVDSKANQLWRVLRTPAGGGKFLQDWNWQPLLLRTASTIADEFYAVVYRAVFRIPFLDLVKWVLGYDSLFVGSLFNTVYEVRNSLQREILQGLQIKDIYLEVKKVSQ